MAVQTQDLKEHNAKVVVQIFLNALNEENFDLAKEQLASDLHFKGVMAERNGAEAYMADMQKMKLKYLVQKVFAEGNDVCTWYDIDMAGKTIRCCAWYKVEDEKIKSFEVIFDPRPVL